MKRIDYNQAATKTEIEQFLKEIDFDLPDGFIDFFKVGNGADIDTEDDYIIIWPITEIIELNKGYNVDEYAPDFFFFGSNGGSEGFAIEKKTGKIYQIAFIGMLDEEIFLKSDTFLSFVSG